MAKEGEGKAKIGVLGASGYTGAELLRLLIRHPRVEIALLTASAAPGSTCGKSFRNSRPMRFRNS